MIKHGIFNRRLFLLMTFLTFTTLCFAVPKALYHDWQAPLEERAEDLLSRMSLEEKVAQLGGDTMWTTPDNRRLGIPGFKMADGPHGVRVGRATCFPTSLALASTWDSDLLYRVGEALGREFRGKGRYVALGPCINIVRDPRGGRSFESMGEDPYLTSRLAVEYVKGVQSQRVIATPKHFACNNQEDGRMTNNVTVSERTLHEIYLPAFKACMQEANAWSVMSAYNRIDRQYCSENWYLLRDILKNQWGFKGYVVSDWGACHSTVNSINAGLDVEKPVASHYGQNLKKAVRSGKVSQKILDDAVRRVLMAKLWAGVFEGQVLPNSSMVNTKAHQQLALEAARKAIVLLKNDKSFLPLKKERIRTIAVVGPNADVAIPSGGGSSIVTPYYSVSPLDGIRRAAGDIKVLAATGGAAMANSPLSNPRTHEVISKADVVIVVVGTDSSIEAEGFDRATLSLPAVQDRLINAVAELNPNTVVVVTSGSAVLMNDWIDKVPAVLQCWFGGQEIGTAIADVLFGLHNPCGKLPITFPKTMSQLPPFNSRYEPAGEGPGYRYYDKHNIEPLFPFGHGLSYTTFDYNNIKVEPKTSSITQTVTVSVDVKNTGNFRGDEVTQLYVHDTSASVERPVKELKAFKRVTLDPNQTATVTFTLDGNAFAFYDIDAKKFAVEAGTFEIMVGSSSRDIRQKIVIGKK